MIDLETMDELVLQRRYEKKLDYYRKALMTDGLDFETVETFIQYHKANPNIWHWFKHFAFKAIEKGRKIGAKGIMERVRWDIEMETEGDFKCNNNYPAYYARIFAIRFPAHKDFFEKRTLTGLKAA